MQVKGFEGFFDHLKHLRVRSTDVDGVLRLELPRLPWAYEKAVAERNSLLETACRKFGYRALWSSANSDRSAWSFPSESELISGIDELEEGGWGLFFFHEDPKGRLARSLELATNPQRLQEMLRELAACFAIVSWYDDNEWIIAGRVEEEADCIRQNVS